MGIGLPIEQIANEDFEKELKEKNKDINDKPHAPQQNTTDIIFYYEENQTRFNSLQGINGFENQELNHTDFLYYSYNEKELNDHRDKYIIKLSGNNAYKPEVDKDGQVTITRTLLNNSYVKYIITTIKSEKRPPRISKPESDTSIKTLKGTFLQNKTGNFR